MSTAPRSARVRRDWGDDDRGANILHVDMDSFFASVEIRERPELRGHPVIVGATTARGVVTSATYEARAGGVRAGQPLAQARRLCPRAIVVPPSRGLYSRYSRAVMDVLGAFTPELEQVSIDEAFLDVSGSLLRLGSSLEIGREIRARIHDQVGIPASVGIAGGKTVAKIASAHAKPDGLLLVPAGKTVEFLHRLPVGALPGVGGRTREIVEREGVETIGDLARLPRAHLRRLVGDAQALRLHDLAWGRDSGEVAARGVEKSVGIERTFDTNIFDRGEIERFVVKASHRCAARLRSLDMVAWTISIKMRDESFATRSRSITLDAPTDLGRDVSEVARRLFAREPMPSGGVRLFGVRAENLTERAAGVPVHLDEDLRGEAIERAVDRIGERFDPEAVRPASLLDRPPRQNPRG